MKEKHNVEVKIIIFSLGKLLLAGISFTSQNFENNFVFFTICYRGSWSSAETDTTYVVIDTLECWPCAMQFTYYSFTIYLLYFLTQVIALFTFSFSVILLFIVVATNGCRIHFLANASSMYVTKSCVSI